MSDYGLKVFFSSPESLLVKGDLNPAGEHFFGRTTISTAAIEGVEELCEAAFGIRYLVTNEYVGGWKDADEDLLQFIRSSGRFGVGRRGVRR